MALKSHYIALDPNNKQAMRLAQHCGYARVAQNHALSEFKAGLERGEWMSDMDLRKSFNAVKDAKYPWCRGLSQNASKNGICNLGDAVRRWRSKQNKFPRYKKRSGRISYQADNGAGTIQVDGKRVKLPRVGWMRMREKLRWRGQIRKCVVSKRAGRWFLSILVKTPDTGERLRASAPCCDVIGVDVGIKTLAVTSDGRAFENPKALYRYLRKLRRAQRSGIPEQELVS